MAKRTTPTFIAELPPIFKPDARKLLVRLDVCRQLYHACPGEALRPLDRMRESLDWQGAKAPQGKALAIETKRLQRAMDRSRRATYERWHVLGDGSGVVQRGLYSAFLTFAVLKDENEQQSIHPSFSAEVWPVAQSLLRRSGWMRHEPVKVSSLRAIAAATLKLPAAERIHQAVNGVGVLVPAPGVAVSLPTKQRVERQRDLVQHDTRDAVAAGREPVKVLEDGLRTACL